MRPIPIALLVPAVCCYAQTITLVPSSITQAFSSKATAAATASIAVTSIGPFSAVPDTSAGGNWLAVTPVTATASASLTVSMNPMGLPDGTYQGKVNVAQGSTMISVPVVMTIDNPGPRLTPGGVVNAASYQGGAIAPGEIVSIFGTGIGPAIPYGPLIWSGQYATRLAGTRVWFDKTEAPLIYAYPNQVAAVVPSNAAGKSSVQVQVENMIARTLPFSIAVQAAAPAVFTSDASGKGQVAALNEDSSFNSPSNPAKPGSIVVFYSTGAGVMDPPVPDGTTVLSTPLPKPSLPVQVTIGGQKAEILYAGAAPQLISGALQVNVRIPVGASSGNLPIVLTVGAFSSPDTCMVSIR